MSSPAVLRVMAALLGEAESTVVDFVVEFHANVTERTPIDTGFARNSWMASTRPDDPGVAGTPEAVAVGAGAASVAEFVSSYRLELGKAYVSNHAEYIAVLNDGSSKQAPKGFVEEAIADAMATVAAKHDTRSAA